MVLMGLVALALVLGALVPQISPQTGIDPQAWLAVQTGILGPQNGLIRVLGIYDLYHATWFHFLLALMGLCLFVRFLESAELAWLATVHRRWSADAFGHWGRRAPQVRVRCRQPLDDTHTLVRSFFVQHGFSWLDVSAVKLPNAVVGRRPMVLWAQPVMYGALLIALLSLVVVGTWGWQSESWQPAPGDSQSVGHGTPYALRLDVFRVEANGDGRVRGFRNEIAWLEEEEVLSRDVMGVGQPATLHGLAVRQVGFVPALKVRAWDADELPLRLQMAGAELGAMEIAFVFPAPDARPLILLPDQDRFLAMTFEPRCADGGPAVRVGLVRSGESEGQPLGIVTESGVLVAEDLRLEVDLAYRPVLRIDYRPAMGSVVGGMALAVIAFAVMWILPARLAWIAVEPGDEGLSRVRILVPVGVGDWHWLHRLTGQLQEALTGDD